MFYKYYHQFYLSSTLYSHILKNEKIATVNQINIFFKNRFKKLKIKTIKISEPLYFITLKFKTENSKALILDYLFANNELFPPWVIFPNYLNEHISWDQGVAYDYNILNWLPFWQSLNQQEKQEYMDKYDCPLDWKDWLHEFEN